MSPLRAIWGANAQNIFAVGDSGVILRYDGKSWTGGAQSAANGRTLRGVWGSSASNVWAVGDGGLILNWNGSSWNGPGGSTATANLQAVWGLDVRTVWTVGDAGTILKWSGSVWSPDASGISQRLNGIWGAQDAVWAVADSGKILVRSGTMNWSEETSGTTKALYAIGGFDANSLFAVGVDAVIVKRGQGSPISWAGQNIGVASTSALRGVSGVSAQSVWVVGMAGVAAYWNGGLWTPMETGTSSDIYGVWAADPTHVWTVGDKGTILYRAE